MLESVPVPARGAAHTLSIPNLLTYARILAVPGIVACLFFFEGTAARWVATFMFAAACITDFLDGYLARLWSQQSALGRMLDPIADKLLVGATLLMLVHTGTIKEWAVWAAVIILCREILVSGLREYLAEARVKLRVTWLAKWKTAIQMVALGVLIAGPAGEMLIPGLSLLGLSLLWLAALLTLVTGYEYLRSGLAHAIGG